jgi:hypothetical protein
VNDRLTDDINGAGPMWSGRATAPKQRSGSIRTELGPREAPGRSALRSTYAGTVKQLTGFVIAASNGSRAFCGAQQALAKSLSRPEILAGHSECSIPHDVR